MAWLGLKIGWVKIDEGGIGVGSLFVVANQRFQTIYFVSGAVEHLALTMHHDI